MINPNAKQLKEDIRAGIAKVTGQWFDVTQIEWAYDYVTAVTDEVIKTVERHELTKMMEKNDDSRRPRTNDSQRRDDAQ